MVQIHSCKQAYGMLTSLLDEVLQSSSFPIASTSKNKGNLATARQMTAFPRHVQVMPVKKGPNSTNRNVK